ncbi:ATP-binding protein [Candidatus Entotheonella palauensis]|uniref:ATP-binding protein n=1 Tax=Candidatus Entotheonella palauensis TaxID=93172 RepID=UPI000B7EEC70|nr:AAA family ATPase [Candidatus Entotheonella palauensis]
MIPTDHIEFGPFRLDILNARLWRGNQHIALRPWCQDTRLRPRAFAVLRYLIERTHQLVTKEELLLHIWPETHVSHTVLRVCILEIRRALGDRADTPTYIETVGRRGYRFLQCPRMVAENLQVLERIRQSNAMVGRQREINILHMALSQALHGTRQLVFVSGEAGVGKTAMIDALMTQITTYPEVWAGRGTCIEYSGPGEAYLPVLEALGQLGERPKGHLFIDLLRQAAPAWLTHLPALLPVAECPPTPNQVTGGIQARMLRELTIALERFTAQTPLVLVLEDLHWSDPSTVDLLTFLAKRQEPAKLLVIGTYRPAESTMHQHPLINALRELHGQRRCTEIAVPPLDINHIRMYAENTLGGPVAPTVVHLLAQRTEGNPLFVTHLLPDLVRQGLITRIDGTWLLQDAGQALQTALPDGLRPLLTKQLERLSRIEQRLLEVASVVGDTFAVAAVTAATQLEMEDVEVICESLARQCQLIAEAGLARWPDGTISGTYRFPHALQRQAIYERISPGRRVMLHRQIGARLEAGFQGHEAEITSELTYHFLQGETPLEALRY